MSFFLIYQLFRFWSTTYAATVCLGSRKLSYVRNMRLFAVQTLENLWLLLFNLLFLAEPWWLSKYSQTSGNPYGQVQVAVPTKTDLFWVVHSHVCSIHCFLTAAKLRSQYSPFSIWTDGKRRKISNSSPFCSCSIYSYISCYFFLIESARVRLLQNGLRIENTGKDNFRCCVDSAQ